MLEECIFAAKYHRWFCGKYMKSKVYHKIPLMGRRKHTQSNVCCKTIGGNLRQTLDFMYLLQNNMVTGFQALLVSQCKQRVEGTTASVVMDAVAMTGCSNCTDW